MSIEYNVIQRGIPAKPQDPKKYYAIANTTGETTLKELSDEIERSCTVNGADIRAVLYALLENIPNHLAEGKNVRLGDLGSFRISISSEGETTEKEVNAKSIKSAKIIFTPKDDFKDLLKTLTYKKKT